ncbi:MAG: ABC transporter substrate-binding protein [Gemmatimonadales bacterium]
MANTRIFAAVRVIPTLLAAATLSCNSSKEPILLGLAGPISLPRGKSMQLAAELAVSEINQRGGLLGRRVELVIRDDSDREDTAIRVANSFYADPRVVAVIGHASGQATTAAASVYNAEPDPVVAISPSVSGTDIGKLGSYTFGISVDDAAHGATLAQWLHDQIGSRQVGMILHDDASGRSVANSFRIAFEKLGGTVIEEDRYSDNLPTLEPYLTRMRMRGGVRALMLARIGNGIRKVIAGLDTSGMHALLVGTHDLLDVTSLDSLQGLIVSTTYLPDHSRRPNRAFVTAYVHTYSGQRPDRYAAGVYDIVKLLANVIESVGTDRTDIRDYLAAIGTRTRPFEGVTGRIGFDSNGDPLHSNAWIAIVRNGQLSATAVP